MYRILLLVLLAGIGGCTKKHPLYTNLEIALSPQPPVFTDITTSIEGNDKRQAKEVILYQIGSQAPSVMENLSPVEVVVTERLAQGFREQGLQFAKNTEDRIIVEIQRLLATVIRPEFLYTTKIETAIHLRVVKNGSSLDKKYLRQATNDSTRRPDVNRLEGMIDAQLSAIVAQILEDEDVRKALSAR
ncbi:MAG: YajG family lipoprotein [Desulfopila sp.]